MHVLEQLLGLPSLNSAGVPPCYTFRGDLCLISTSGLYPRSCIQTMPMLRFFFLNFYWPYLRLQFCITRLLMVPAWKTLRRSALPVATGCNQRSKSQFNLKPRSHWDFIRRGRGITCRRRRLQTWTSLVDPRPSIRLRLLSVLGD